MNILSILYHKMYTNPIFFKINCFLVRKGIEKEIAYYFFSRKYENDNTTNMTSLDFFQNKKSSIDSNLMMLSDEKSRDIYLALIEYRIKKLPLKKNIYSLMDQYFVDDFLNINDGEVFVDCGAFVGDTINNFLVVAKKKHIKIKKIIALEPEHENFNLLSNYFSKDKRIIMIEAGVSDCKKSVYLTGESAYARTTQEATGTDQIELVPIDGIKECSDATYIKMDIEGAELDALRGAAETIRRNKPKLAICIYHSNADYLDIIPYVKELNQDYKLFVRHHSRSISETVLYAIP
ncbi:FkbM family methyltransferase [Butyrivibrio sp. XBB1001]|uniref:FkbM family methyltransferase n=1 Tax=Butyrivibrio sp. XBB1001 TaxID=1280682 RepID=UPI0003FC0E63|nr:FkbM family methyltransferase [Butyrivibrio sp. XBB1001]